MIVPLAIERHHADHLDPITRLLPDVRPLTRQFSASPGDIALIPSYGMLIRSRRWKFRKKVLAQHGAGQSYGGEFRTTYKPGYPGGQDNGDVGLFLVPNEHAAKRWRAVYPKAAVAVVGCPKLDDLPARVPDGEVTVAVSFHWDPHWSPEAGTAFPHYSSLLPGLSRRVHLIGHGHPMRADLPAFYRKHGIEYVKTFDEVCRRADLYVCDNSSTIFEFAATGRPVVVLNSPAYRKHIKHGLRFWGAADVGLQVDDPKDLYDIVAQALHDGHHAQREAALAVVYAYRQGAAQRAADAVMDWAGIREAVA